MQARATIAFIALMTALALPAAASAQDNRPDNRTDNRTFSLGYRFVEVTGEELFANVCQGCHMPDAAGASGAGSYPSLAGLRRHDDRRPGRRRRELCADAFRQRLSGCGDGQGRQGCPPLNAVIEGKTAR